MSDKSDEISRRFAELIEELGITRFLMVIQDPDSDAAIYADGGESMWTAGAARYAKLMSDRAIKARCTDHWKDEQDG